MNLLTFLSITLCTAQVWYPEQRLLGDLLQGVSFSSPQHGIVVGVDSSGSVVYETQDGGATYSPLRIAVPPFSDPPAFLLLVTGVATSRSNLYVAGTCAFCFENAYAQYTTTGNNFQLADIPSFLATAFVGSGVVRGSSPTHATLVGTVFPAGSWVVFESRNGGQTYTRRNLPSWGLFPYARYISMPSATTWYVTAGSWPRENLGDDVIPVTQHVNYRRVNNTYRLHYPNLDRLSASRRLNQAPCPGCDGFNTMVWKTTDGGVTWSNMLNISYGSYYLNTINCLDVNNCWTVSGGDLNVILQTSDGGVTWTERYRKVAEFGEDLMDVKFVNAREGFVAGSIVSGNFGGFVLHTTDGGVTWSRDQWGSYALMALDMYVNPQTGKIEGHATAFRGERGATLVYRE